MRLPGTTPAAPDDDGAADPRLLAALSADDAAQISVRDALPLMESGKPDTRRLSFEAESAAGWRRAVIVP